MIEPEVDHLDPRAYIIIKRARVNNLKNLSVAIPRNKLVVITGLSGSGKSSLAFDTLFAEGQRMYVESLSSYARQFLGRMEKPDVDYIRGVSPAIAIEQKVNTQNSRSTVGTTTEIYDYLKLLFARIGRTYSPISGEEVKRESVSDVVDRLQKTKDARLMITAPLRVLPHRSLKDELSLLLSKGFTRVLHHGEVMFIEEELAHAAVTKKESKEWEILIDRAIADPTDETLTFRLADSVQTAFYEGHGECIEYIETGGKQKRQVVSDKFEKDGIFFTEPSVNFFSFNNPYGACRHCEGFGNVLGYSDDLIFPNKNLTLYEGAISPWRGEKMSTWLRPLLVHAALFNFPIHTPVRNLNDAQISLLWEGNEHFEGLHSFFTFLEKNEYKIQYRVMRSRFRGRTVCPECLGTRIRKDAAYVKINGKSIVDLVLLPINEVKDFFEHLSLSPHDQKIAARILIEIRSRLLYMSHVGLEYLTLNRMTNSLSGGEYQRIKLATGIGSALVGSIYILDEPSIGLHPRDTERMVKALLMLRDLGNTVVVVEHEEEVMRSADQLIDIGPDAGTQGGTLVFQGTFADMNGSSSSHTVNFLTGKEHIPIPQRRRWNASITIVGAAENNLKNIDVSIPLHVLTVVSGVSGSGKSSLLKKIFYPALVRHLDFHYTVDTPGKYASLQGDLQGITQVEFIDQNPIGKSSRSNPISYVKAYDAIRTLFSNQLLSKQRGYPAGYFSFNTEGGRCEMCKGEGEIKVEMQFMADIYLPCESCKGKRFTSALLEVFYEGKNIADILDMTVEEALIFFKPVPRIYDKILALYEVGLGYIKLGQSSTSLSGGEAQRVKLASFLTKRMNSPREHILFLFDEPTTGLHFHDIAHLLKAINSLVNEGHTAVVIEHNVEVIKSADWVIDLGPEGGEKEGGHLVFAGTPEDLAQCDKGYTGTFLRKKLHP